MIMKYLVKISFTFLLLTVLTGSGFAQDADRGILVGKVIDAEYQEPLIGVNIIVGALL